MIEHTGAAFLAMPAIRIVVPIWPYYVSLLQPFASSTGISPLSIRVYDKLSSYVYDNSRTLSSVFSIILVKSTDLVEASDI